MGYMLEDIRVIDAASFLAGPGAATVMADFGADVIKIEPPNGDGYRVDDTNVFQHVTHWFLPATSDDLNER